MGLTISKVRTILYTSAKYLGDINAIRRGKIGTRIKNRILGKIASRVLGKLR